MQINLIGSGTKGSCGVDDTNPPERPTRSDSDEGSVEFSSSRILADAIILEP